LLNNRIFIATFLSLEKRRNAQTHRKWQTAFWQILFIALPYTAVLSWRALVISTFVADKRLRLKRETEMQTFFSAPMLFSFSHLVETTGMECMQLSATCVKGTNFCLQFKVQRLSYRACTVLSTSKALRNLETFTKVFFRKCTISWNDHVLMFW